MFSFLLFLFYLSINTAAVVGDPMLVKRRCVGGCYPDDEQHCAAKTDAENYKEFPVNQCSQSSSRIHYEKIECNGDTYKVSMYYDENCTELYDESERKLGCQLDDDEIGMRAQLLQELPNNELEIELCAVNDNTCNTKYKISSKATECISLGNGDEQYYMTWGSKGELILYNDQTKCNAKDLISAVMIAPNIRNKKPVVYYPSTFITCNGLPVAAPPKKLEIFKCADSTCGECAPEDSSSYESYTSGECMYNPNDGMYSKYECTKNGMVLTEYRVLRANGMNGCTPGRYTTTTSYLGGCSRPFAMRGRSYGPDGSELCESTTCKNYTLVKGTTTCTSLPSVYGSDSSMYYYTWKDDTLAVYRSEEPCKEFERVFVATGFDKPTPTVVYENSVRVLCGGEGENPLPPRPSEVSLVIAACGDGNPTDAVDTCGMKKEGQCASRSMTTGKCLWDDTNKFYYMAVCNSTTYAIYNMGDFACETSINGKTTIASVEWGKTGCAELSRRARVVGAMQDDTAMVEFCLDDTRCGEFFVTKGSTCSSMGAPRDTDPPSPLSGYMFYTWNSTLSIYANEDSCTTDVSPVFVAADFKEGSNVTYTPYQYVTCDGQPVVGATTSTSDNTTESGCLGYTKTQMVLMAVLILFAFSI